MFSFSGLASGLDTARIVEQLVLLESRPLARLEQRRDSLVSQQGRFSEFRGKLLDLEKSLKELGQRSGLSLFETTSSDDSKVRLSAGDGAVEGDYDISVQSRAQKQSVFFTSPFGDADQTAFGGGEIGINVGGTELTTVTIDPDDTLNDIRDKINASEASVQASVIYDGNDYQLVLTAEKAGIANGFEVGAVNFPAAGPLVSGVLQEPSDAEITINGLSVTSPTNSIEGAIEGVTIELLDETSVGETVGVSVRKDVDGIAEKLEGFIDAYNDVRDYIDRRDRDDVGSSTIDRILQRGFQSVLDTADGFGLVGLSQVGIQTDGSGRARLDREDLEDALESNFEGVIELFAGKADGSATGIADIFDRAFRGVDEVGDDNDVPGILSSGDGSLALRERGIRDRIRSLDDQIVRMQDRIARFEEQQNRKFAAFEELSAQFQSQGAFLTAALAGL